MINQFPGIIWISIIENLKENQYKKKVTFISGTLLLVRYLNGCGKLATITFVVSKQDSKHFSKH